MAGEFTSEPLGGKHFPLVKSLSPLSP